VAFLAEKYGAEVSPEVLYRALDSKRKMGRRPSA
jgi:hypothetical protein